MRARRYLTLRQAAHRWNTYLFTVYGHRHDGGAPRSLSDYFAMSSDDREALAEILRGTHWRQGPASKASGRSALYAFSIALRKEFERDQKRFAAQRDRGRAHARARRRR